MRRLKWVRVSFEFDDFDYHGLMCYVDKMVRTLGLREKFFFLFEEHPTFMVQLDTRNVHQIQRYVDKHPYPYGFQHVQMIENPGEKNPYAVEFYKLGAKHALYKELGRYKDKYQHPNTVKILHCLCNQMFRTWKGERLFYFRCLIYRGVTVKELIWLLWEVFCESIRRYTRKKK